MKKIGIVILSYNNWEDTINCINSVLRYNTYPIKIMVVDNGSTKGDCVGKLHSYFSETFEGDYLRTEENQEVKILPLLTFLDLEIKDGYARGNNKGLKCFDKSYFETFVVAFFLFSMLEVAPLESTSQHCFRLWFCLGSIISKTQNYDNIITNIKLQQRKGHN